MTFYFSAILLGLSFVALGLGIYISMRIFNLPDITTDGSYTLGGAVTAVLLTHQISWPFALLAAIISGALAGALTGLLHTRLKINALLAGILVMTALYSVNLTVMQRSNLPLIGVSSVFSIPSIWLSENTVKFILLCIFVVLICLSVIWLLKTDFGIAMRATGNSEQMVKAQGVNSDNVKIIGLAFANSLVALSGFLVVQLQGFSDINMGIGIVLSGLGAVIIGETFINWIGKSSIAWRIAGVVIGTLVFRLILAFTLSIGLDPNLLKLVTSAIVLLVVALPGLKKQFVS
jgi:putative ABC transport system permease protein